MENRLIELSLQRGRLQERIAAQRAALTTQLRPVVGAVVATDQALVKVRHGIDYVKRHPAQVGVAVALLALLKPKGVWRWGRRSFVAWQLWKKAQKHLAGSSALFSRPKG